MLTPQSYTYVYIYLSINPKFFLIISICVSIYIYLNLYIIYISLYLSRLSSQRLVLSENYSKGLDTKLRLNVGFDDINFALNPKHEMIWTNWTVLNSGKNVIVTNKGKDTNLHHNQVFSVSCQVLLPAPDPWPSLLFTHYFFGTYMYHIYIMHTHYCFE